MVDGGQIPAEEIGEEFGSIIIAQRIAVNGDKLSVQELIHFGARHGCRLYLSVLSLMMMIKTPWNLTFSSGLASKSRAIDHALGDVWSCVSVVCVEAMAWGLFG